MINLKTSKAQISCAKKTKFYTRAYKMGVMSIKRCPNTGSCIGDKCIEILQNESLPELEAVNNLPGITQCVEGMNNWPMTGCFYATAPCTFYRYYASPIDARPLEIFECVKWDLSLPIKMTLTKNNGKGDFETIFDDINLIPEFTSAYSNLKMTLTELIVPPIPNLVKPFITDGKTISLIETELDNLKLFYCKSKREAQTFKTCSVNFNMCSCRLANDKAACTCHNGNRALEILHGENTLPFEHNGIIFKSIGDLVIANPDLASAHVELKIEGMKLRTEIEMNSCKIKKTEITGCHSCEIGAILNISCVMDFSKSLGNIICTNLKTAIICDPTGNNQEISVHFDHAEIYENCEIFCPSSNAKFIIKGKLATAESPTEEKWIGAETKEKKFGEINLPMFNIIKEFFNFLWDPTHLLLFFATIMTLIFLSYCFLTIILHLLLTTLYRFFSRWSVGIFPT